VTDNGILILKISCARGLIVEVGPLVLVIVAATVGIFFLIWYFRKKTSWDVVEAEIPFPGMGKVKLRPSYEDIQIAHKAWVELATRKAGIPLDEENDTIVELYNSWYELFREMRNLAKQIPADRIRKHSDTQELVRLLVDVLNQGLRPHLTRWQSRFRRWYDDAIIRDENKDKSPQEIQKGYPEYAMLIADLKVVNEGLVKYTAFIKRVAQGEKQKD
jgi:hypothetical protein